MELSSFNIKKNSYISGNETLHFSTSTLKKKIMFFPKKSPALKKFLIFCQKKAFLIFPEMEPCTFQLKLEK